MLGTFLFLPDLLTLPRPRPNTDERTCPLVQSLSRGTGIAAEKPNQ